MTFGDHNKSHQVIQIWQVDVSTLNALFKVHCFVSQYKADKPIPQCLFHDRIKEGK